MLVIIRATVVIAIVDRIRISAIGGIVGVGLSLPLGDMDSARSSSNISKKNINIGIFINDL